MLADEVISVEANLADADSGLTKTTLDPALGVPTPLVVTVTELSTPSVFPPVVDKTPGTFHYFPYLPTELRLKIWRFSALCPRVVELHARRTHYADEDRDGDPLWQSLSRNSGVLSANAEARAVALKFYTVTLRLCDPIELPLRRCDRLLYINLKEDTVVLLGDLAFVRLNRLLNWFREQDIAYCNGRASRAVTNQGKGLRRLAMSCAQWDSAIAARTLQALARNVFADIEELVLFIYEDGLPPKTWTGGRCILENARPEGESYRRFAAVWGQAFRNGDSWIKVGKRPLKVADISFENW